MQISTSALKEFQKIWEEENPGCQISEQELAVLAERVLHAVELVIQR